MNMNIARFRWACGLVLLLSLGLCWPATTQESGAAEDKVLVMIAGRPSHPPLMHEHNAGVLLLSGILEEIEGLEVRVHLNGWPESNEIFEGADAIALYMDGSGGHPIIQGNRLEYMGELMAQGVSLVCIHFACHVPAPKGGAEFREWIGGHYETSFSVNPVWEPEYDPLPTHPITRGVSPFSLRDEWYFNIRFREGMDGVTSILSDTPSDDIRKGPYVAPPGPYQHIIDASGREETMMWAVERPDGGRGVGFTGGHYHMNWGNNNFRTVVLNALVWASGLEVPENGVPSTVTEDDLMQNLDDKQP